MFVESSKRDINLKVYRIVGLELADSDLKVTFELVEEIPVLPGATMIDSIPQARLFTYEEDYPNNTWIMDIWTYRLFKLAFPDSTTRYAPGSCLSIVHVLPCLMPKWKSCTYCTDRHGSTEITSKKSGTPILWAPRSSYTNNASPLILVGKPRLNPPRRPANWKLDGM
ncbi:hypothetical protein BV22DRAFT_1045292 [Leucogyrophana mollusca]|uniref:Uncharacterized protein n=1 Tax=Leucogyrophana mollusca TaxID=85980 RepID=A0ACB8BQG1_9AGAM|nr:hypothetical protein BV22DRAFT_1045292 [Leucogyrophana mollusca]